MMNNISLVLKIVDFEVHHQTITEVLKLAPTDICMKGELFYMGPPDNLIEKKYETNYWEHRVEIKNNTVWIKNVIDKFCEELLFSRDEELTSLNKLGKMELSISIWFKDEVDSFHFDNNLINFFCKHNIEIDIDQYLLK